MPVGKVSNSHLSSAYDCQKYKLKQETKNERRRNKLIRALSGIGIES